MPKSTPPSDLYNRLREVAASIKGLESIRLSDSDVAKALGMTRSRLSQIKCNGNARLSGEAIASLSSRGWSAKWIMEGTEPRRSADIAPATESVDAATRIVAALFPMDDATRWATLQAALTTLRYHDSSTIDASSGISRTVIPLSADDSDGPIPPFITRHW